MISAFLCNLSASHQVSAQEVKRLEDDDVPRIPRWPFSTRQSFICKLDDFSISESPCCMKPSSKFQHKRVYGLEEDVCLRIPKWLFSARQPF